MGLKGADRSGKEAEESTGTSEASEERNEAPDWSGRGLSSWSSHVWRCIHRLRWPLVPPSLLSLVRPKTALTSRTLLTESRPTVSESPPCSRLPGLAHGSAVRLRGLPLVALAFAVRAPFRRVLASSGCVESRAPFSPTHPQEPHASPADSLLTGRVAPRS